MPNMVAVRDRNDVDEQPPGCVLWHSSDVNDCTWILDKLDVGVWVGRAPDGAVLYANEAFRTILGTSAVAESPISRAPTDYGIVDRLGRPYPVENLPFSRVLAARAAVTVEDIVIARPDGSRISIRATGTPAFDDRGDVACVIVAFSDKTKEVESELARATMEARLAFAVNHAPIVIWSADTTGVVGLSEGSGLAGMGFVSGQLVGQNIFDMYRDHPTIPGYLRRGLAGESLRYTVEVPGAILDSYVTPLRDAAGNITGVTGLSNDVTELRRLQAIAIQNDRVIALGTLAASVAHEINNPLTYLMTQVYLTERSFATIERVLSAIPDGAGEEARRLVQALRCDLTPIQSAADRIARITRQLKSFSRSGDQRREPLDIRDVVRSVLELVGKDVAARARLRVELEETAYVVADEARLVQVVLNLLVNAMQAVGGQGPEAGEVVVRTRNAGDRVELDVEDSGPGVAAHDRERIFDAFFSTKELEHGTGLGLFVCRSIVRELGGDVVVDDRPGGGARFRVTLPAGHGAARPPVPSEPITGSARAESSGRILLIDDEAALTGALASLLRGASYTVVVTNDGKTAIEHLLSSAHFDLVFCDLMMEGTTGMDVATILQERAPHRLTRTVFMTGGAFTPAAAAFCSQHAAQCIDKPFDILAETTRRLRGPSIDAP